MRSQNGCRAGQDATFVRVLGSAVFCAQCVRGSLLAREVTPKSGSHAGESGEVEDQ